MKKIFLLFFILFALRNNAQLGQWTWVKGPSSAGGIGVFGTKGVSAPANVPPGVYEACEWTDQNFNFWMFGGVTSGGENAALFKYNPTTNEWTWMHGTATINAAGVYGTKGVSSPTNMPGARGYGAMTTADKLGNLWLFGGYGYDVSGIYSELSDLWKYDIATNEWTWMAGPNTGSAPGVYGTLSIPAAANYPPPRSEHNACWIDSQNNIWLYGGLSSTNGGTFGDLWKFDVSVNQWVWMDGTQSTSTAPSYGTLGVEIPANDPGGRYSYTKFVDASDNLFFYGAGTGYPNPVISDVWKYNPVTQNWTWIGGQQLQNNPGNYVAHCDTVNPNLPGSKFEIRASWPDACGFFFMGGFDASTQGWNDLWYYSTDNNKFTWVSGLSSAGLTGTWGTQGVTAPTNMPSGRGGALSFYDNLGNLWLFGGYANDASGVFGQMGDLWKYTPDPACVPLCSSSIFNSGINANFTGGGTGCSPLSVTFDNSFSNGQTYLWDFGDGTTDTIQDPTHIYNNAGNYDVSLIVTDSTGADTVIHLSVVHVGSVPTASFSAAPDTICSGQSVNFTNNSTGPGGVTNINWQFGDGGTSTLNSPTHTYNSASVFTVILTVDDTTGFCPDTMTQNVVVLPIPNMAISAIPISGCAPLPVTFSSAASTNSISYDWLFGDGGISSLPNPSHTYSNGSFVVTLVGQNSAGCKDSAFVTINVGVVPVAAFTENPDTICTGQSVNFTNNSSAPGGVTNIKWLFGDGATSTLNSPAHIYNSASTFTVTLMVKDSSGFCADTLKQNVVVVPFPNVIISAIPTNGCEPLPVSFSSAASTNSSTINWLFGDGGNSSLPNPNHTYQNNGIYPVTLIGQNTVGCKDSAFTTITVYKQATASFTADPLTGCFPFTTTFTNTSTNFTSLIWTFLDDTTTCTDTVCLHAYGTAGSQPVKIIAKGQNGCNDTLIATVNVVKDCEEIHIPNVFTPNGDSDNDQFLVLAEGYESYQIEIYDRWGLKMFASTSNQVHWNGNVLNTGGKCPDGTYYYMINVKSITGTEKSFKGYLGLYR